MTRRVHLQLAAIVSDDGTRCAAECPHRNTPDDVLCMAFRMNGSPTNIKRGRAPACIAAEQAAASAEGVADMLRDDLHEVEQDARDMADQLNECARLLGCERGDVVRSLEAHLAGGRVVASMLVAREQAAASVPSCEGAAWAIGDRVRHEFTGMVGRVMLVDDDQLFVQWPNRTEGWLPTRFASYTRIPADDHLDGGARSLDASEALREARVHGMREGARIMQECMRLWRGDPDGTMPDWENADTTLAAAIEAVRKGER